MNSLNPLPLEVVILAAGKGKRMFSDTPKVLHKVAGRPLLQHVVDSALALQARAVHIVVGHEAHQIQSSFQSAPVQWAMQSEQLGTGHAVAQAIPQVNDESLVLVLYGDVPLIKASTLNSLVALAQSGALAVLTLKSADPTGLGRIIRDTNGLSLIHI